MLDHARGYDVNRPLQVFFTGCTRLYDATGQDRYLLLRARSRRR